MAYIKNSAVVVLVALLLYYVFLYYYGKEVILKSKFGTLKGYEAFSRDGRSYSAFRSIPFAKPPIGELRFQPPVPSEAWEGVKDASVSAPLCLQADLIWKIVLGQEDCLYLNVFTPKIPKSKSDNLLPVMVFIHGGFFMFGGSDVYNPDYFMDEEVVLVTIHYRLGALGFLNTGDDVVSGNMGLKDQVMALKWVQSTIKDFGGDPNLVTVFGESAGGASTHLHMFSELSKGLFQRAISQSGTALIAFINLERNVKSQAKKFGEALKCPTKSSDVLLKCLQSVNSKAIVDLHTRLFDEYSPDDVFGPRLELGNDLSKAFLKVRPRKLYQDGDFAKVAWLAGVNSGEGCWLANTVSMQPERLDRLNKNWKTRAPDFFFYEGSPEAADKILEHYFGKNSLPLTINDYPNMSKMYGERGFQTSHGEAIRIHAKHAATYSYYFDYKNPNLIGLGILTCTKGTFNVKLEVAFEYVRRFIYSHILRLEVHDFGVCHSDELQYLFYPQPLSGTSKWSPHYEFSKSLLKLWVSFATIGNPGKVNGIEWLKVEPHKPPRYMHFGEPGGMIDEPFTAGSDFWNSLNLNNK